MGTFGWTHWLIVALLALLLFGGRGKISEIMGDFAKGIKSFKKGMAEDDETAKKPADAPKPIEHAAGKTGETTGTGTTSKAG